jgi:hypothetical protein
MESWPYFEQALYSQVFMRGLRVRDDIDIQLSSVCSSRILLGNPDLPGAGGATGIPSAVCTSPCPVPKQCRSLVASVMMGSSPRRSQVPLPTSVNL